MNKTILALFVLCFPLAYAQTINIPDANFKNALLGPYTATAADNAPMIIDANGDNEIQVSEILDVEALYLGSSDISDLTGIENFVNLKFLHCDNNQITNINVQPFTNLKSLSCSGNPIVTLDVSGLSDLQALFCNSCALTSINLGVLPSLQHLFCNDNNLATLDLSGVSALHELDAGQNPLTSLDVSSLQLLESLFISDHFLTSIDLTSLQALVSFTSNNSALEIVDVSNNPITYLECEGNPSLQYVFMKNGGDINEYGGAVFLNNNPSLQMVCTDEAEIDLLINKFDQLNMNVMVTSYCSFTPGGDYKTITGTVTFDVDGNGCDENDALLSYSRINIDNGTDTTATYTNVDGTYSLYSQQGNFIIAPAFQNDWFIATPASAEINLTEVEDTVTQDFCITANGLHPDLDIVIVPVVAPQPGFDAVYELIYSNKGNQTLWGAVTFNFQDELTDFVSADPVENLNTPGLLTWNYSNLLPFESRSITIILNVNGPMETPAVNIGDQLDFIAQITPVLQDETPDDNQFALKQEVVGSFDPNDITCLEGAIVSPALIGEYLHYNINFENTGTAAATFIVVEDVIDESQFDISTLQILDASHNMTTQLNGNKIIYRFDAINLGTEEKGNVVFKIKTLNTLQVNDDVTQKANIFFDYNFPIETNDAETIFASLSLGSFEQDATVKVYPNPANDIITIAADNNLQFIEIFDIQGRVLETRGVNEFSTSLDLSERAAGVYLVRIKTEAGIKVEKVIKF